MSKPTPKQYKVIGYIESNLVVYFKGSTADDARQFISRHIEESKRNRVKQPSFFNSHRRPDHLKTWEETEQEMWDEMGMQF